MPGGSNWNPCNWVLVDKGCKLVEKGVDKVTGAVGGVVSGWIDDLLKSLAAGLGKIVAAVTSLWLKVSTPGVSADNVKDFNNGTSPTGASDVAKWLADHTLWLSSSLTAVCLIVVGAKMAYELRGAGQQLRNILQGMVKLVLLNFTFTLGVQFAIEAGDQYTDWIINESLGGDADVKLGAAAAAIGGMSAVLGGPAVPLLMVFVAVCCSLLQLILMYFRAAILVLLCGTIAIPASTAFTGTGSRWLSRWITWVMAFLCLKPAAATVYAAAYRLMGSGTDKDLGSGITGFVLLSGAVFVLPALLKLFQPAGIALTGGGGGGGDIVGEAISQASSSSGGSPSGSSSSGAGSQASYDAGSPSGAGQAGLSSSGASGLSGGGGIGGSASGAASSGSAGGAAGGAGAGAAGGAGAGAAGGAGAGAGAAGAGAGAGAGGAAAGAGAGAAGGPVGAAAVVAKKAVDTAKAAVIGGMNDAADVGGGPDGA
ncbi:hypothetical protein FHS39_001082 [Streptomyces olivoverticillatus]|uniref:TrbL/VirB6 plasmid conjugal transfer protein n=1 Tax=Streptomyces olivoverticillatus TaxID=66427 RepID=A0A7W7PJG0_9ACTN|nr:hypothetical protein [Streptomyces olivoverticillatus]MBB4892082.1 hypothetical protein [Streptomyces olivoverticillatus]